MIRIQGILTVLTVHSIVTEKMNSKSKHSDVLPSCTSMLLRPFRSLLNRRRSTSTPSPLGYPRKASDSSISTRSKTQSLRICRYDVFLSFRGTDTRNTFIDHLYHHLVRKGIFTFKDDQSLHKGDTISSQLLQAIQDSRVSIVVLSKDYAASSWCLDEMAAAIECRERFKQSVFPIFYDVDPSDVRNQGGVYEDAFVLHTEKFRNDPGKVERWKKAMRDLGGLAGWDVRDKPEFEEIKNIVQEVIETLHHKFSQLADDLIGMQHSVESLERLLKLSSEGDGFRVLGIWGMGGIGKTTLATVLYDRISYQFEACCFIEDVNKIYKNGGGVFTVQKQILRRTIDEKNLETYSPNEISKIVRNRLQNIKVLIVLDNVDQVEQLLELHINPKSLCVGSRIIITTRDEHILREYGADIVYEAQLMNDNDAHELLCRKAFKSDYSSSTFAEMIPEVLKYVQGLPLAIRVVGSFLCTRDTIQWRAALKRLRNNPDYKILEVLQISFDGLHQDDKEIFLHIACFFKGEREDYVRRIMDCCGLNPDIGIPLIIEKSLITIRNQEIHMHEMLQDLGKQIVRSQYPNEPKFWSRLWLYEHLHYAMMTKMETDNVKAIVLDQKEDGFNLNKLRAEDLSKMRGLKLLILNQKNFSGSPTFLSNFLLYLSWNGYPFTSLPSDFQPYGLVELNMPDSSIELLWEDVKHLPSLKRMDLSHSKNLKEIPSFERIQALERLDLTGCINLLRVHPSIGHLTRLTFLSFRNCSSLVSLDFGSVSNLSSLRVLRLSGCHRLENTPNFRGTSNLEYLEMDQCTGLSMIHESIGDLAKLKFLSLRDCTNLVGIPNNFNTMTSLVTLDLCGCLKLTNLPLGCTLNSFSHLESLIFLDLSFCNLCDVPSALGELGCLERLNLQGNNFVSLPSTINRLNSLAYLNLAHCHELQVFPNLPLTKALSAGRYFRTASGSRNHRSGLYIFDCPKVANTVFANDGLIWLPRLIMEPRHFRCGFDIVLPLGWEDIVLSWNVLIPQWFHHRFDGSSVIRIVHYDVDDNWIGFAFCVALEIDNSSAVSGSPHHSISQPLPHPLFLSFESEHTEECFNMPLNLELNKIDGSKHLWVIYISRQHCHFVKTGAHISFKARPGFMIRKWGMRMLFKGAKADQHHWFDLQELSFFDYFTGSDAHRLAFDYVEDSSSNRSEPKIQLPYNWLFSEEEEDESSEAKSKEIDLSNLGL